MAEKVRGHLWFAALLLAGVGVALPGWGLPIQTFTTRIPVNSPDDDGNPVTLDAEVIVPDAGYAVPGIIWNHGFGGHKGNDRGERETIASYGYIVLSYTSRGFGDTPGQVDLMGAKERQDLIDAVDWLIAPDNPIVGGGVIPDRIGQAGASYGGFHAWALARSGHPAVRTVVPIATSTNLYEALVPYNVPTLIWPVGFYATGFVPEEDNYSDTFHQVVVEMATGVNLQHVKTELDARAVNNKWDQVNIPVFIIQGINDSLFPANQAMDAYQAITARGIEARLYLGGIGHPPALSGGEEVQRIYEQVVQWFDRHLKGAPIEDTPLLAVPPVEVANVGYFNSAWDGMVRQADAIGTTQRTYYLKTTSPFGGVLTTSPPLPLLTPLALAVNTYAGSGYLDEPVTRDILLGMGVPWPNTSQLPGVLTYETAPFTSSNAIDLAGIPNFDLLVTSAHQLPIEADGLLAAFQLDPKVWDVDPSGNATLITRGAFSEAINSAPLISLPVHYVDFNISAAFYTFQPGHKLRITLSTEDLPFLKPTTNPFVVAIHPGSKVTFRTGGWLSAPVYVAPPVGQEPYIQPGLFEGLANTAETILDLIGVDSPL